MAHRIPVETRFLIDPDAVQQLWPRLVAYLFERLGVADVATPSTCEPHELASRDIVPALGYE